MVRVGIFVLQAHGVYMQGRCVSIVQPVFLRTGGGAYSFVAYLSHLTIDHASLSRRSNVPTPVGDTSNISSAEGGGVLSRQRWIRDPGRS